MKSTVQIHETPGNIFLRLCSRVSTYFGIAMSVLAICIVWCIPSLGATAPEYHRRAHAPSRRRRSTYPTLKATRSHSGVSPEEPPPLPPVVNWFATNDPFQKPYTLRKGSFTKGLLHLPGAPPSPRASDPRPTFTRHFSSPPISITHSPDLTFRKPRLLRTETFSCVGSQLNPAAGRRWSLTSAPQESDSTEDEASSGRSSFSSGESSSLVGPLDTGIPPAPGSETQDTSVLPDPLTPLSPSAEPASPLQGSPRSRFGAGSKGGSKLMKRVHTRTMSLLHVRRTPPVGL